MDVITDTETNHLSTIVTFYRFDCPKCGIVNWGDDMYGDWKPGQLVTCKCGYRAEPETRKVDVSA